LPAIANAESGNDSKKATKKSISNEKIFTENKFEKNSLSLVDEHNKDKNTLNTTIIVSETIANNTTQNEKTSKTN
jgi:hypothetical protein